MEEALDMSLDDLIKRNRNQKPRAENGDFRRLGRDNFRPNRSDNRPSTRRLPDGGHFRATPYSLNQSRLWMREGGWRRQDASCHNNAGTKLYVSNLDSGVSHEDIKVLFSDVGELKRYAIHYDSSGSSQGTAEVVYARRSDALSAIRRFDNVHLDGRPIKIELVGFDSADRGRRLGYGGGALIRSNDRKSGHRQGQGGGAKSEKKASAAEALDADLDKYHHVG